MPEQDDHRQRMLEPPENAEVRDTLDDRRFYKRIRELVTKIAIWVTTVGGAIVFGREQIAALLSLFFGGPPA